MCGWGGGAGSRLPLPLYYVTYIIIFKRNIRASSRHSEKLRDALLDRPGSTVSLVVEFQWVSMAEHTGEQMQVIKVLPTA